MRSHKSYTRSPLKYFQVLNHNELYYVNAKNTIHSYVFLIFLTKLIIIITDNIFHNL